jgi:hemolysin activation/secretion protein
LECVILLRLLLSLATAVAIAMPQAGHAEAPPEPGAIERTIPTQIRPTAAVPIITLPVREARAQRTERKGFTLGAVNIDGATVFSQQDLSRYFEPYLATEVDQGKLAQMAQAITAKYRQTGYLLSYAMVPPQAVEAGMVRLSVVEGRIDKVSVDGAGSAKGAIEAIAAPLVSGGPLKSGALERSIGLIRDFPGFTITDIALMRSDVEGGRYTLKITMAADRLRGFTYADNRGTGSVGHSRLYDSVSLSSLAVAGDEIRVDLFAMPGGHSRYLYGQLLAAAPLGRDGMRVTISGSRGDQYLRADEHFSGQSDNISAQLSYPFLRSRSLTLVGKASLTDWRSVGTQGGARKLHDRLRVARFGVEFGNEGKTRFQGELLLSRGLGFAAMTRVGDPLASRPDAGGKFTKAALALQAKRALDDRFTVSGTVLAQYSDRPLLSAEEFSLGGNRIGRAFDFNEETGDRGFGAGAEISYRLGKANDRTGVELFGYVDGGVARDLKSKQSPGDTHRLASTGVGTRFSLAGTTISLEAGVPLKGGRRPRLFGSIFRSF